MSNFTKVFPELANAITTQCWVLTPADIDKGERPHYVTTENCIWDTGADTTILTTKIVKELGLKPKAKGGMDGIGGFVESNIYDIHLGIPSGELIHDLEVMELPDEASDYDVIIGMDVISLLDFSLTSPKGCTKFSYSYPSVRDIDFEGKDNNLYF